MSRPVLRLEADPGAPVDMTGVLPAALAGEGEAAIAARPLRVGNREVRLGELFTIRPGEEAHVIIEGCTPRLDRLGAGMTLGTLELYGDAGAGLGLGMRGGRISLFGSAGDHAGAAMQDGLISIQAHAGAFLGAALPGAAHGMAGGAILVHGDAGDRAGDRMRRGTIAVNGTAGDYLAARLIGGTVLVGGRCGLWPGYGLRRGSVLLADPSCAAPAFFVDGGAHDLPWLGLLDRHLAHLGWEGRRIGHRVRRLTGDVTVGGKGELLIAA